MGLILTETMMGERIRVVQMLACCAAGVGTTMRGSCVPPTGSGSTRAFATVMSASVSPPLAFELFLPLNS